MSNSTNKNQFTTKRTTFKYYRTRDIKVELTEEWDLEKFILDTIKQEVSPDKVIDKFLKRNPEPYKRRLLEKIEFQEPEVELNHVWKDIGVNTIEGRFTLNIKYLPNDEIRYQVQVPFTPIGEEEHIADYEIHTFYYERKLHSICDALFSGAVYHLEAL